MHTRHRGAGPAGPWSPRVSGPQPSASVPSSRCPRGGVPSTSSSSGAWAFGADPAAGDSALQPHLSAPGLRPPPSCGAFIQTGAVSPSSSAGRTHSPGPRGTPEQGGSKYRGVLTSRRPTPTAGGPRACACAARRGRGRPGSRSRPSLVLRPLWLQEKPVRIPCAGLSVSSQRRGVHAARCQVCGTGYCAQVASLPLLFLGPELNQAVLLFLSPPRRHSSGS